MTCYVLTGSCPHTQAEAREEWADGKDAEGKHVEAEWYRMLARKMRRTGTDGPAGWGPNDGPMFLCDRSRQRDATAVCPCGHLSEYLCDAPIGRGKTCDKPMCRCCRANVGPELDHCAYHVALLPGAALRDTAP